MIIGLFRLVIVFLVVIASTSRNNPAFALSNNATDQQALVYVKSSIRGDSLDSWNHSVHFCLWQGVTCNSRRERVTKLDLSNQHLEGTLSPYIGNLSFLREINLDTNNFHGSIPGEIGQLFSLQYLILAHNSFEGTFPSNLTHCYNIKYISMSNNRLGGKLPTEFTSWSNLTHLILATNNLIGPIPPSIGNMSSLSVLDLKGNNLGGSIPWEISQLFNLSYLVLAMNNLSGMVPLPLYNMSLLSYISVTNNSLEGSLPADLGFTLPNLQGFCFALNKFSGAIPPSISNASNLFEFDIGSNLYITGPLRISFERVPNLEKLDLGNNPLGLNKPPGDLINSLVNCTRLHSLALYKNEFKGEFPNSIGNLSTSLSELDLRMNYIYGSIPKEILKLVNLTKLLLSGNSLTGMIPESIGQLYKLQQLYLYGNNISGRIPASISNITKLVDLRLQHNMLQGSIPPSLFSIPTLQSVGLYNNHLNGVIPEQLDGLSLQCTQLFMHQNLFTGSLPLSIGSLKQLITLTVFDNKFTGEIPATLGDCEMLEVLSMDRNLFEGIIPPSFKKLKSLQILDLSNNLLSGKIPSFLQGFPLLQKVNLSHNNLAGEVPDEGVFSNISAFSVIGNMQLCGGIQALHLPACDMNSSRSKKQKFPTRFVPVVVFLPLALLLASLALIIYRLKNAKTSNISFSAQQDGEYPRVSYRELLQATDEFSLDNLIGEGRYGSVYKGLLKSLGQIVAVKVLNVHVHGAYKSFLAECQTLSSIRHRNLIKIITAVSTTDSKGNEFKAIVFEFMEHGSLDNWLHPNLSNQGKERNLTLHQRIDIATDVALAVDYLHHHSHTRIIHCDIKPSNILLDKEFVARVGDFGLARLFVSSTTDIITQPQTNSTGVRGTIGYVPPEYGMGGEISAEGDVYSYGILLLELFSGKRPTGSMLKENSLHDYVKNSLPNRVMDIADPRITSHENEYHGLNVDQSHRTATIEACLASIFQVGLLCSVEAPKERMDIGVALKQLNMAKELLLSVGTNSG